MEITGSNNVLNTVAVDFKAATNMLIGISGFKVSYFKFQFIPSLFNVDSTSLFINIYFGFWNFRKRFCQVQTPFYDETSNRCYDICPILTYSVSSFKYCIKCSTAITNCQVCTSQTQCTLCSPLLTVLANSTSGGTYCGCQPNFYVVSDRC